MGNPRKQWNIPGNSVKQSQIETPLVSSCSHKHLTFIYTALHNILHQDFYPSWEIFTRSCPTCLVSMEIIRLNTHPKSNLNCAQLPPVSCATPRVVNSKWGSYYVRKGYSFSVFNRNISRWLTVTSNARTTRTFLHLWLKSPLLLFHNNRKWGWFGPPYFCS